MLKVKQFIYSSHVRNKRLCDITQKGAAQTMVRVSSHGKGILQVNASYCDSDCVEDRARAR